MFIQILLIKIEVKNYMIFFTNSVSSRWSSDHRILHIWLHLEGEFFDYLDSQRPEILKTIVETKDLPDSEELDAAITNFKEMFIPVKSSI